jgi:haloacetate dehalogenase
MFENFTERYVEGAGAKLFLRQGGNISGPPLLLLHGYPQTSAMWDSVASILAPKFNLICPDLRGYGRSEKPTSDSNHTPYSKRAMAADLIAVMKALSHKKFFVAAHDRGARVAHRMGQDHPEKIHAMTFIDIAPTREMYAKTSSEFAKAYWHWFFLIQKYPMPETMIEQDPDVFWKLKCFNQAKGDNPFSKEALEEYLLAFRDPKVIHASCEDYRASATIDIKHDDLDGDNKLTVPLQILWAKRGVIESCFDALAMWRERADNVVGCALDGTHYIAEEHPELIAKMIGDFCQLHEKVKGREIL